MNFNLINEPFSLQYTLRHTFSLLVVLSFTACHTQDEDTKNPVFPVKAVTTEKTAKPVINKSAKSSKKKKKIYITFDDGPNKGTRTVLNITQQEQAPVSFFLVGSHAGGSAEQENTFALLKASPNVELCNHSYSHANNSYEKFYNNTDSVVADFKKARALMQLQNNVSRCPGRNAWRMDSLSVTDIKKSKAAFDSLYSNGFTIMGWDVEWHFDHKTMKPVQTPEKMAEEIDSLFAKNKTRHLDNIVVLAHDQAYRKPDDSAALHRFIKILKNKPEYELEVASNYPLIAKAEIVPDTINTK